MNARAKRAEILAAFLAARAAAGKPGLTKRALLTEKDSPCRGWASAWLDQALADTRDRGVAFDKFTGNAYLHFAATEAGQVDTKQKHGWVTMRGIAESQRATAEWKRDNHPSRLERLAA